ncbi:hypothetical protein OG324_21225 [Streptomyces sp. NBC_01236]|nr:hypothetical protein OG324_21225 [Streptomyces sp. NBC_01236]
MPYRTGPSGRQRALTGVAPLGQVTRAVKRKLKMLQYRPEVIDRCLAGTGLTVSA